MPAEKKDKKKGSAGKRQKEKQETEGTNKRSRAKGARMEVSGMRAEGEEQRRKISE